MELTYILLILYIIVVIIIGYVSSLKEKNEDFLIANRKLSSWVIAFTIAASFIGGNTLVNYTGFVYEYGAAILWGVIGTIIGFVIMILLSGRIKRFADKKKLYTLSDYFTAKYGVKTGAIAGIMILTWYILAMTVQFIAGARVIESISSLNYTLAVVIMCVVVLTYSFMGGFKAVVKTDFFQYSLFAILLIVIGVAITKGIDLDYGSFLDIQGPGIGKILSFIIITACFVISAPELWQRMYAAKNNIELKKGLIIASFLAIITGGACIGILGLAARASFANILPEQAAIMGLTVLLPASLKAVGLVLFFAVIMSTIDTLLFILSNVFARDIWMNFVNKKGDFLKLTKIGLILFSVLAVVISLFYSNILALGLSFLSVGLSFTPAIIGSFFFKLKPKAVSLSFLTALAAVLILLFMGIVESETSLISLPVSLVFLLIGQVIFKK